MTLLPIFANPRDLVPVVALLPAVSYGLGALLVLLALWAGWRLRRALEHRTIEWRASEARFRALFEHAVEGVYEARPEGGFRSANPALARLLGFRDAADLVALPPDAAARLYVSPTRRAEFFATLGALHCVENFESEVRRPDGSTIWIRENVRAVRDADGRLQYLQGFVSDITARRDAETALRASEERFRVLFQHSPIGIVECDYRATMAWLKQRRAAGVGDLEAWLAAHAAETAQIVRQVEMVGANAAALRLIGARTLAEAREQLPRVLTDEALAARRTMLVAAWRGRFEAEGECSLRALDGSVRRVFFHWWTPTIEGRPGLERTQLALIDLTEARSTESALALERERLGATLQAMGEAAIMVDFGDVVQCMNAAAGELTGWPPAAAMGQALALVCGLRHEKETWVAAPTAAARERGELLALPPDTMLQPRTGAARHVAGRCAPLRDAGGRTSGAVLVLRDVTDRVRMQAELVRAAKLESIGVLAGGIAHDFNNLLSIVMGNLTLALMDERTAASGGRWLREAERGTLRARELTQQLLAFAKGGEPLRSAVLLPDIVREAAEFALHGTPVRCEFETAPDLRPADVDRGQIGQVVQNLIMNAAQAMPGGGVIRVRLHNQTLAAGEAGALPAGNYLRLEIADTGKGIAPEHLAHVFEPFFTTKERGSGLGLATVHSVIQKHRGHIVVESRLDAGTTFRMWLPAARAVPAPVVTTENPFTGLHGRALFMDDEESIRTMTQALLERLGLETLVTSDGGEAVRQYALARMEGKPFDVVIMDLTVPGAMGGAAAMQEILKIDPKARGIVSSGYSSDPVMANYRTHGFRGVVPKPYRVAEFARTIREVITTANG
ncbi:MAG TPA: PAS domain S-box protein [Opitutaceae bacterium]|nr:PAS domain S-box protein [Opitutaceae bacterium]